MRFIPAYAGNARRQAVVLDGEPVHPRIRGERPVPVLPTNTSPGSSPHTRGTRGQHHSASDGLRFIPAYAGNALGRIDQPEDGPVHPRIRGERHLELNMNNIELGSSPHTRGTRIDADRYRPNTRFIPAYAGNAPRMPRRPTRSPVHPRIRGERKTSDLCKQHPDGSSPHTRGTLHRNVRNLVGRRFIPAYAGNASSACGQRSCSPVHPRIRGEREVLKKRVLVIDGSSPHTRGTPEPTTRLRSEVRFIPAYAGNATGGRETWSHSTVHPRIRGERANAWSHFASSRGSSPHTRGTLPAENRVNAPLRFIPAYAGNATISSLSFLHLLGSSPHTRGTLALANAIRKGDRFIPAYAGNASLFQMTSRRSSVHPRIRGERIQKVDLEALGTGSSPHTRGTRTRPDQRRARGRFIPAYAGNAEKFRRFRGGGAVHPRIRGERARFLPRFGQ